MRIPLKTMRIRRLHLLVCLFIVPAAILAVLHYHTWMLSRSSKIDGKLFTSTMIRKNWLLTNTNLTTKGSYDVLLSAYMNSGSRFTGRLLGFRADSFYFYEPLWKFSTWNYYKPPNVCCSTTVGKCRNVTTEEVNKYRIYDGSNQQDEIIPGFPRQAHPRDLFLYVLSAVLSCRFRQMKNIVQERVHDHISYSGPSWDHYRQCIQKVKGKLACLRELENVCSRKKTRVAKVIRLTLGAMEPLLDMNPRLKVVHLLRDPRAIIHSRMFTRGYPVFGYRKNDSLERILCDKMQQDINDFWVLSEKFPSRILFVYYEDLLLNLHVRLKQLFHHLNMTYDKSEIDQLAKIETNVPPPEKPFHETHVDRKNRNAIWWRKYMNWSDVQRVDKACSNIYQTLGYRIFHNEAQLRDLNYDTLNIPRSFQI